jgi:hypothetical protein
LATTFIRTGGRTGRGSSACCFLLILSSTAFFARPVRGPANGSADLGVPPVYGVHERTYMLLQAPSSAFLTFRPPSDLHSHPCSRCPSQHLHPRHDHQGQHRREQQLVHALSFYDC